MSDKLQVNKTDFKLIIGSGGMGSNATWIMLRDVLLSVVDFIKTHRTKKSQPNEAFEGAVFELGDISDDEIFTEGEWATKSLLNPER